MWTFDTGKACYDGDETIDALIQDDIFEPGLYYIVKFTISSITQGGLSLESIEGKPKFTTNGEYSVYGKAIQNTLEFKPYSIAGDMFIGCVDDVATHWTPLYRIEDGDGNIVFEQSDNDTVQIANENIQYGIDWNEIPLGNYKIKFTDENVIYQSGCLCVVNNPCSILLAWSNDENAGGFNYSDLEFTQNLRVEGKLGEDFGKSIQEDLFRYSDGSKKLLYAELDQYKVLVIKEMPAYLHRALMIGVRHDHFFVNGDEMITDTTDYQPAWRKSSDLAPVTIQVTPKDEGFINQNCS